MNTQWDEIKQDAGQLGSHIFTLLFAMAAGHNKMPDLITFLQILLKVNTSHFTSGENEIGALPTFTPSHTCPIIVREREWFFFFHLIESCKTWHCALVFSTI